MTRREAQPQAPRRQVRGPRATAPAPVRGSAESEYVRERLFTEVHAKAEGGGGFVAAGLLAVSVFLLLSLYSAYQVTRPSNALSIVGAGIAATTDIDRLVDDGLPVLKEQAREEPQESYALPGYPLDVTLTHSEVTSLDAFGYRELLLERGAYLVYDDGLSVFDRTGSQDISLLSLEGVVDLLVGQLTESSNDLTGRLAVVALAFGAIAGAVVLALFTGFRRFQMLGLAIAFGAIPGFVMAWGLGAVIGQIGSGDAYTEDLREILRAILDVGRTNFMIVSILGLMVAALGPSLGFVSRRITPATATVSAAQEEETPAFVPGPRTPDPNSAAATVLGDKQKKQKKPKREKKRKEKAAAPVPAAIEEDADELEDLPTPAPEAALASDSPPDPVDAEPESDPEAESRDPFGG